MSDIIKSNPEKLSRQTGRRKQPREKVQINPVDQPVESEAIASSTLVEAAVNLADAELVEATRVYAQRTIENHGRFQAFTRMVQAQGAAAIEKEIESVYGLTKEQIYGA